jgi:SPP1 family predicted phage head-tail adaptor
VRAGQLDRQISIERKQVTQDPTFGTELVTWVPLASERFWAQVQDALPSRAESVTQGLAVARNQVRVRMRYRDDIDSSMRITVYGDGTNQVLQIVGGPAAIEGRKQFLEMVCERISG